MIETILSTYGDRESAKTVLETHSTYRDLAFEFCNAFGVKVTGAKSNSTKLSVVDHEGIPLGYLQVDKAMGKPVYIYNCHAVINKTRSSRNSDSSSRDSNKINTLIRTLKKNDEIPTAEIVTKQFLGTIKYGFNELRHESPSTRVQITRDTMYGICQQLIGLPVTYAIDMSHIQDLYNNMIEDERRSEEGMKELKRFAKGVTTIRLPQKDWHNSEDFYLIGKAWLDSNEDLVTSNYKRYDSMSDTPYAGLATMCKTYFSRDNNLSSNDNEFGLARRDRYFKDLDIISCYSGTDHFILIPDNAE